MANEHAPKQACSHCGSTRFGIVHDIWMEIVCEARTNDDWGSDFLRPHFTAVVCKGCNLTQMFMRETEHHLLRVCEHEVVDVGSPTPYR